MFIHEKLFGRVSALLAIALLALILGCSTGEGGMEAPITEASAEEEKRIPKPIADSSKQGSTEESCIGIKYFFTYDFDLSGERRDVGVVREVLPDMPASLLISKGDLITEIEGERVSNSSSIEKIKDVEVGETVIVTVMKPGSYEIEEDGAEVLFTVHPPYQKVNAVMPTKLCPDALDVF